MIYRQITQQIVVSILECIDANLTVWHVNQQRPKPKIEFVGKNNPKSTILGELRV